MNKDKVLFIRAKLKDDYVFDAIKQYGYRILIPYKDKNIILRLMRELWFKLKLPGKRIWFNKAIAQEKVENIIVLDPLITSELLDWIVRIQPESRVILDYENRADTTIVPSTVGKSIEKWSYDKEDCDKYGMKFVNPLYFDIYRFDSRKIEKKEYDVLYLGRDKGRLKRILNFENKLRKMGLKTYFHICADRSYMRYKKLVYKPVIPYSRYLKLMKKSKAILNIVRDGQSSVTQRELEAVFDNIKCITTNIAIKDFELYDKSRYFVLGDDAMEDLVEFLECPFKPISDKLLDPYRFEIVIENLLYL